MPKEFAISDNLSATDGSTALLLVALFVCPRLSLLSNGDRREVIADIQRYAGADGGRDVLLALAGARDTEIGQAILRAVELRSKEEQESVIRRPRRDEAEIKNDLYFRLGFTAGLAWILDLAPSARKALLGGGVEDGAETEQGYDPTRDKQGLPG